MSNQISRSFDIAKGYIELGKAVPSVHARRILAEVENLRCVVHTMKKDQRGDDGMLVGWWNDMKRRGISDDAAYAAIKARREEMEQSRP